MQGHQSKMAGAFPMYPESDAFLQALYFKWDAIMINSGTQEHIDRRGHIQTEIAEKSLCFLLQFRAHPSIP